MTAPAPSAPSTPRQAEGKTTARPASRWKVAFFGLALVGVVVGVAWALMGSKLMVVRSIAVTGTHLVQKSEVSGAADVPLGTPLGRVNTGAVAQRVETIRQVASATVSKSWPDRLTIAVTERVPVAAVRMAGGGYDLVDKTGVIVRWSQARPAVLPQLQAGVSGGRLAGDPGVTTATAVLGELPRWLTPQVAWVSGSAPVALRLRDGKTVVWGGTDRVTVKVRELAILMRGPARYFDVSAPGTAITR